MYKLLYFDSQNGSNVILYSWSVVCARMFVYFCIIVHYKSLSSTVYASMLGYLFVVIGIFQGVHAKLGVFSKVRYLPRMSIFQNFCGNFAL